MVDRLSKLLEIFSRPELDFRKNRAEGDDILGDAYEYLMRHFATQSGKSKGQFYAPAEVSRIMARAVGINNQTPLTATIYDPTCGSGSLLLKAADAAPDGLSIYGQEKDVATFALARMNMVIHNNADADLWRGNVITQPHFLDPERGPQNLRFRRCQPAILRQGLEHRIGAGFWPLFGWNAACQEWRLRLSAPRHRQHEVHRQGCHRYAARGAVPGQC